MQCPCNENENLKFDSWSAGPRITAILNPGVLYGPGGLGGYGRTLSYLIEGSERALLLDTGFGIADIKQYVESLSALPLIVVNTHVHPDHSGGNAQFRTVYVGENEVPSSEPVIFPESALPAPRCTAVENVKRYRFACFRDGESFELGGRELKAIEIPGHSRGSMALIDSKTKILFSGDAVLKRVLLFGDVPIREYKAALERLDAIEITDILCSHWPAPLGRAQIRRMIRLLDMFDPAAVERAPWKQFGTMCVFRSGDSFEDPEFCAIGYPENRLDDLLG